MNCKNKHIPQGHKYCQNCGEEHDMTNDLKEKFEKRVNELKGFIFSKDYNIEESPVMEFGYRIKEGNTYWTIPDWEGIYNFFLSQIKERDKRLVEEIGSLVFLSEYIYDKKTLTKAQEIIKKNSL